MKEGSVSGVIDAYSKSLESTADIIGVLITRLRETGEELSRLQASTQSLIDQAVKDEREACAELCSAVAAGRDAEAIEEAILARGGEK